MLADKRNKLIMPHGANLAALTKLFKSAQASRAQDAKEAYRKFKLGSQLKANGLSAMAKAQGLKLSPQSAEEVAYRKALYAKFRKAIRTPKSKGTAGHNPAKFPPYASSFNIGLGNGNYDWITYGRPSVSTGETGGDLAVWQGSTSGGGSAYAASDVGFFYYAQTTGTLIVTAYINAYFYPYLYSPVWFLFALGSASCFAQIDGPTGVMGKGETSIYDKAVFGGVDYGYNSARVAVQAAAAVQAGNWYLILGGVIQNVFACGNCDAEVSVRYATVDFFAYYQD